MSDDAVVDLLVVGAGPTGIAIGVEAGKRGLSCLLVDRGALAANLLDFPTYMTFFTTRDLLEIGGVPFSVPQDKPSRREALAYYRAVAAKHGLAVALHEEVRSARRRGAIFEVRCHGAAGERRRSARAVALATGYFHRPRKLGVAGEDLPWVHSRYLEPYRHYGERVAVIGGGNSAVEAALDMWRNGVEVTLVHRRHEVKPTVKYWIKPDIENRISEAAIGSRLETTVRAFTAEGIALDGPDGPEVLEAAAAYVLIGYEPDVSLQRGAGVRLDPHTLVPAFDPSSCESNVPGLYIAGTLQAGRDTNRIFIENSRVHSVRLVEHLAQRLGRASGDTAT